MPTSADQLVADYCRKWRGYRVDGKGYIVPAAKFADLDRLDTRAADFEPKTKSFDPGERLGIAGVANAAEVDRMAEILLPRGCVAGPYMKNSVLLYQHDHDRPVGLVTMLSPEDNGVKFDAWVGDPKAGAALTKDQEMARSLIAQRILKAVSVGFIPLKIRMPSYDNDGNMVDPAQIESWEMLELSIVSVPCNAGALFELKGKNDPADDHAAREMADLSKSLSFPTIGSDGKFKTNRSA